MSDGSLSRSRGVAAGALVWTGPFRISETAVAKYALEGLRNKVLAVEYRTALPAERILVEEMEKTRRQIEARHRTK